MYNNRVGFFLKYVAKSISGIKQAIFYCFVFTVSVQPLDSTSGSTIVFSPAEKETGVANRCNDDQCDAHH